ncbi:UDP-N-acetylmuramoyl-L-alanyl-D-glutamate--2,6-diaminopimelate ligase [Pseudoflavonifractor capillosus]|uniref:UDP-N-acetylmuramoyl-L-alanyl-D-glutamate--2, 6-diaminopimelate ligase n=1 Tax=Pseudoflavonifractor capillosus TaxID=106588 RepID=UPI0019591547|nr:UDP-N-acetylmuramoyl-L-alanyl-D-glutamate--2,6-diaminopimelate ligase [Pseudoflavonifractor capillosus]MBM6897834.1 UDP-N-acetylmuramoyl-L-alanyl-D-glutamate--2,6-diaminopimelate ligase [Pseudoflavonifractor capillosus]
MKLSHLLAAIGHSCDQDVDISALTCDSRTVTPGALFVAICGAHTDGTQYIQQAVAQGAAAIVSPVPLACAVPLFVVEDPRSALAHLAAAFYGHPAKSLTLIGITGTKGKTTAAHMVRDILLSAGYSTGMIGTMGAYVGKEKWEDCPNTTPEPLLLHRLLHDMVEQGCTHVVMEVSSQAMKHHRLAGLTFAGGVFLNLSPDHIGPGEHADYAEYTACKAGFFAQCALGVGNGEDMAWPQMAAQLPPEAPITTFGFAPNCDVQGVTVAPQEHPDALGTRFTIAGWDAPVDIPLPGRHHVQDALAAAALCGQLGLTQAVIRQGLAQATVPGRAQVYPNDRGVRVIVDYAHNAASFRAILSCLHCYPHGKIIVVFGAGGNRPPMRRLDMAQVAAELADYAIVTTDNPRWEPVEDICRPITQALGRQIPWQVVYDRKEAIFQALDLAQSGDMVALLGKGHETYIETCGVREHFSEWEVLEEYFHS